VELAEYLERIDYAGTLEPTKETLFSLQMAHHRSVTYENLDIHLGKRVTFELPAVFDRIVRQRRGGWCFGMNALFGWALAELGFHVTLHAATVGRESGNEGRQDGHLVLLVHLEQTYLADVGFGAGFREPLPMNEGSYSQGFLSFRLSECGSCWLFHNDPAFGVGYGFTLEPKRMSDFDESCEWLQTSPESGFVNSTVCHRMKPDHISSLRGVILKTVSAQGVDYQQIVSLDQYRHCLRSRFDLAIDAVSELWEHVVARHRAWLQADPDALEYIAELRAYDAVSQREGESISRLRTQIVRE